MDNTNWYTNILVKKTISASWQYLLYTHTIHGIPYHLNELINLPPDYKFTFTDDKLSDVIKKIFNTTNKNLLIYHGFKPKWYQPWKKNVRAYVYAKKYPTSIWLNTNRDITDIQIRCKLFGTIMHEICHLHGYGHGKNNPDYPGYKQSVPYLFGLWFYQWNWELNKNIFNVTD